MRHIAVLLVDRANYGRLKPVMSLLKLNKNIKLSCVCSGTMSLEKYGLASENVEQDGFEITSSISLEIEGNNFKTMSSSIGLGIILFSQELEKLNPDILLVIGDRYETLAAVISASYQRIKVAHIQGGEVSGSIDEMCRHAITKFSWLHFPATNRSAKFLQKMGEEKSSVFNYGCPSADVILNSQHSNLDKKILNQIGVGGKIDFNKKFLLVTLHPNTMIPGNYYELTKALLDKLENTKLQTIWLWPNIDATSDKISKSIRIYRENTKSDWLHLIKNLKPEQFYYILSKASCAIGNSSSFVRDSSILGTPVMLIGKRQFGREFSDNVKFCDENLADFESILKNQLYIKKYKPSILYGKKGASKKIVNKLIDYTFPEEKYLSYINEKEK